MSTEQEALRRSLSDPEDVRGRGTPPPSHSPTAARAVPHCQTDGWAAGIVDIVTLMGAAALSRSRLSLTLRPSGLGLKQGNGTRV